MSRLRDLLNKRPSGRGPVDPLALFETLTLRNSPVQEIWRPQADALRDWHNHREASDTVFRLNTGAGKTLIGLLAAQSLVNETRGRVLYVCANNQLLEQTKAKADEYGIGAATYYIGQWSSDVFARAEGPGLTNYQAVFNGKSIFEREELSAVVFDDAHTAHGIVREQYTLKITRSCPGRSYEQIVELIQPHFSEMGRGPSLEDVRIHRDKQSVLFVPTFVTNELAPRVHQLLLENGVADSQETLFAWEHLRDHVADCAMLVSANAIEITPPLPPVHSLRLFGRGTRRLYLSATLNDETEFCRTFGRFPTRVITPGGRAGDTERMILMAPFELPEDDAIQWARAVVGDRKALVMVPFMGAARNWEDMAEVFRSLEGHARIERFAESEDEKIILVGRYDGVDLPGDDCRVMIIHGLPVGISLLEQFWEGQLDLKATSGSLIATRFVQMLGRISRGMSDFGVVLLLGHRLLWWIASPANRSALPGHIQKQLDLADMLRDNAAEFPAQALIDRCLRRDEDWVTLYDRYMQEASAAAPRVSGSQDGFDPEGRRELPRLERKFLSELWNGQYADSARTLDAGIDVFFRADTKIGAWYTHWLGHALTQAGAASQGMEAYRKAGGLSGALGRTRAVREELVEEQTQTSQQAQRIADLLANRGGPRFVRLLREQADLLIEADSTNQHEASTQWIGEAMGLVTSRPDNDLDVGPDVLWVTPDESLAVLIELKTDKTEAQSYGKDDMGQYHQHIGWVADKHPDAKQVRWILGPRLPVSGNAAPPPEVWLVAPDEVARVGRLMADVCDRALKHRTPLFVASEIDAGLEAEGITWSGLVDSVAGTRLTRL